MSEKISLMHAADGSLDPEVNAVARATIKKDYARPSNEAYVEILRGVVRNCVDIIVLNSGNLALMGWRVNEPWKSHWHPSGGGQVNGESYQETGALHLKRDLGLIVDPARLHYVNSASFPWSSSAQGVPCHMNGVLMAVQLSEEELAGRSIPAKGDFAKSDFFPLEDVTVKNGFHPAIVLGVRMLRYNQRNFNRLGTIPPEFLFEEEAA